MFFFYYCFLINFPGIQVQGFAEHFMDNCGGVISWINQVSQSIAFAEGWGLYAEMLIAEDTDSYDDNPLQKYGALKWRVGCFFVKAVNECCPTVSPYLQFYLCKSWTYTPSFLIQINSI